jgi:hypothetical protein
MYSEVELYDIVRDSVLSLNGTLEDGYSCVQLVSDPLVRKLVNQFRDDGDDTDWSERAENGSNESGEDRGDESMDIDHAYTDCAWSKGM